MFSFTVHPVASPRAVHRHVGLEVVLPQWRASQFLSITPSRGIGWFSEKEFSQGHPVFRIDHEPGWDPLLPADEMLWRISRLSQRRYNLLTFNCDHLVKSIIGQPIESPQVRAAVGIAAVGLLFVRSVQ